MRNGRGCGGSLGVLGEKLRVRRGFRNDRGKGDSESGALACLAGYSNVPTHHLAELARDGQPQTGAAELAARRSIGLSEGPEELGQLLRGHADAGVADTESNRGALERR